MVLKKFRTHTSFSDLFAEINIFESIYSGFFLLFLGILLYVFLILKSVNSYFDLFLLNISTGLIVLSPFTFWFYIPIIKVLYSKDKKLADFASYLLLFIYLFYIIYPVLLYIKKY